MTDKSEGAEARVKLADLAKAMQEVRRMQDRLHAAEAEARKLRTALTEAQAEARKLGEALEFYANPRVYAPHPHGLAFDDRDLSFVARDALSPGESK